jgi:hypothetical protein
LYVRTVGKTHALVINPPNVVDTVDLLVDPAALNTDAGKWDY